MRLGTSLFPKSNGALSPRRFKMIECIVLTKFPKNIIQCIQFVSFKCVACQAVLPARHTTVFLTNINSHFLFLFSSLNSLIEFPPNRSILLLRNLFRVLSLTTKIIFHLIFVFCQPITRCEQSLPIDQALAGYLNITMFF